QKEPPQAKRHRYLPRGGGGARSRPLVVAQGSFRNTGPGERLVRDSYASWPAPLSCLRRCAVLGFSCSLAHSDAVGCPARRYPGCPRCVCLVGCDKRGLSDITSPSAGLILGVMIFAWLSGATSAFRRRLIARAGADA